MESKSAPVIGLVGGIGSGKSAVGRWFAENYGGALIDADVVGHQVLLCEDVKTALRKEFGQSIFAPESDGEIDRSRLAAQVFGVDRSSQSARKVLEAIVYPVMGPIFESQFTQARQEKNARFIVFDAAVLLESGWRERCDVVAFIDVPRAERLKRVAETRGWSEDELVRRESSQWPLERKRAAADVVIDNSGTVEEAGRQLAESLVNVDMAGVPSISQQQTTHERLAKELSSNCE